MYIKTLLHCLYRFDVYVKALLRCLAAFSAALACSDIAAVCCDARIVRWQEILSPSYYPLERPQGYWNALSATGTPAGLIAATRARVCDGNAMNV